MFSVFALPGTDVCARFAVALANVTLTPSTDIFDVMHVPYVSKCANACVRMRPCKGFVATRITTDGLIECQLTYDLTYTMHNVGSVLWELL